MTRPLNLTNQQWKVLQFIRAEVAVDMPFPSKGRIAEYMGWKTPQGANDVLAVLYGTGYVKRTWIRGRKDGRRVGYDYFLVDPD